MHVAVIGLDSEPPSLWDRFASVLPTVGRLRQEGVFLPLRSTDPPITVPAWISMLSGRDPGELGIYGFRNRVDHGYGRLRTVSSQDVKVPRVWDVLSQEGYTCVVVGVPGTWPPPAVRGALVSDFLTPPHAPFTYPESLAHEVRRVVGHYQVDVEDYRTPEGDRVVQQVLDMTQRRFDLVEHLAAHEPWDFLMVHEIGLDRIHHAFWRFMDPESPLYEPSSPYATVIEEYHAYLDLRIRRLLDQLPNDTLVVVVSDHGSKAMQGGFSINDWLIQEGLLTLGPAHPTQGPFDVTRVDMSRTQVWAEGGYYARLFLNVKGREPQGVVAPEEVDALAARLQEALARLLPGTKAVRPHHAYRRVQGHPPDLMVYLGDLSYRALASVGHRHLFTLHNDTGPDGANHDSIGVFLAWDKAHRSLRPMVQGEGSVLDVASTLLAPFGLGDRVPGRPLVQLDA